MSDTEFMGPITAGISNEHSSPSDRFIDIRDVGQLSPGHGFADPSENEGPPPVREPLDILRPLRVQWAPGTIQASGTVILDASGATGPAKAQIGLTPGRVQSLSLSYLLIYTTAAVSIAADDSQLSGSRFSWGIGQLVLPSVAGCMAYAGAAPATLSWLVVACPQ